MEKKKNVLIVHNYYQIPGGEDTVVTNEMKMLQDNGYKVILYSRNNSELKEMGLMRKLFLPFITIFNPKTYRDIKIIIKKENIDIVHVHNTLNLISPAVYYAARKMKKPVVQTIHNFRLLCPGATFYREGHICEDCVEKGLGCAIKHSCYRGSKLQTLACVINTWIHRKAGIYGKINYICLTEFNREKLLQLKQIEADRVFVKPNFVNDDERFIPAEKRSNQLIFVGRVDKLKGIDLLLNEWKKLGSKAPKLIICGIGPLSDWCKDFIEQNNINAEFLGFISNKKVIELIASSKALVLPTQWYEGFPMTIVESYSVGTPVICPDMGNVGSVVIDGITGWKYKVLDIAEIKRIIEKIPDSVYRITYDLYTKNYNEIANINKMQEIYNQIGKE